MEAVLAADWMQYICVCSQRIHFTKQVPSW